MMERLARRGGEWPAAGLWHQGAGMALGVFLVLGVLCGAVAARAAEEDGAVASVVAVRGAVSAVNKAGETRTLAVKSPLFLEDTITTAANGRLQIMFKDNTIFSLGSKSQLRLVDYSWDAEGKQGKLDAEVKDGVFRVMGGLMSKATPKNLKVNTPFSTIGIRGSMYSSRVVPNDGLSVIFEGGKGVTLQNGSGEVAITVPGYGSHVGSWQAPPSPPSRFSADQVGAMQQGLQPGRGLGPQTSGSQSSLGGTSRLPQPSFSPRSLGPPPPGGPAVGSSQSLATLTEAVQARPEKAAQALRDAVAKEGVPVEQALDAVLRGMANVQREQFDAVVKEALSQGLTVDKARDVAERLKASGGVCR